jgi:hypothetical protein
MSNNDVLAKRFVVYHDENYHRGYVYPEATKKIIDFLSSPDRKEKTFVALNATDLNQWIQTRIKRKDAGKTCIVFSQDMVPGVLAPDFSQSVILRRYLDSGGRIVWIGDVPFFTKGKFYANLKNLKPDEIEKRRDEIWKEWNVNGIFSILGLSAEFNNSPEDKVTITELGKEWGLRDENKWYGTRPVIKNKTLKTLAETSANRFQGPELIKPEEKPQSLIASMMAMLSMINVFLMLFLGIATGFSSFYTVATGYQLPFLIVTYFLAISFLGILVLSILQRIRRKKKYPSAWIKNFNSEFPDSGFVRIWDYIIYDLEEPALVDLFRVATHRL